MSHWLGATVFVVIFLASVQQFGLITKSKEVTTIAYRSLEVIRSSRLSEEAKEIRLQKNAKLLFGLFFAIAFCGVRSIVFPLGILWLGEQLGWVSLAVVFDILLSPGFLLLSSILAVLAFWIKSYQTSFTAPVGTPQVPISRFSALERLLYRLAFNTGTAQVALADVEDALFAKQLSSPINRPVFITALPRAGTTLLLECFSRTPEFATHCYRDMPFVLIPCLWNRFSEPFQKTAESQERAHGDGMQITSDSPEALEEVVWKTFWRRHYQKDRIIPWEGENNREFEEFFRSHLRKIMTLRRKNSTMVRYLSKNNLNIARTRTLRKLFPDAVVVVPFRHPLHHCASLLEQHRNFLQIHKEDSFASEYMRAIGHYDFGQNLCPIDFDGWFDERQSGADSLAFWLEYWLVSYRHLLTEEEHLNFFDYDALCEHPEYGLKRLAEVVDSNDEALISSATRIRHPRPKAVDPNTLSSSLLKEASLVHAQLKQVSLNYR